MKMSLALPLLAVFTFVASGQELPSDRLSVPFSDPSRPGTVRVNLVSGDIKVSGYQGKEVIVEARVRDEEERAEAKSKGMRRIANAATGLTVEEDDNVMKMSAASHSRTVDLTIQVPVKTSLSLKSVNDGDIRVERVEGEIEVENINGGVTLSGISGSVVAHALNEDLVVSFVKVSPDKSMSFSSLNGDVDVTFPPDLRARVAMKSDQGEIYSDFDVKLDEQARQPVVEESRGKGGKYRVRFEKTLFGTINGGGPEIQFKTFNGDIYIRKATR